MMFCIETYYDVFFPEIIIYWNVLETYFMTQIRYTEQLGTYFPVVLHVRLAMCVICCFIMWHMRFKKCKNGDGSTPMIFWGVNRVRIVYRPFWGSPRCDQCPNIAMDQYLYIPFLVGWTSTNPSYFDVNYRGTRFWPIPIFIHRSFSTATESMFFDTLPTYDGTTAWDMVGYGFVWKVFKSPTCWRREDRKDHESWYPLISNMLGIHYLHELGIPIDNQQRRIMSWDFDGFEHCS